MPEFRNCESIKKRCEQFIKQVCVIGYMASYGKPTEDKPRFITGMVSELRDKSICIKIMHRKSNKVKCMYIGYYNIVQIEKCKDETHILWKLQHDN